MRKKIRKKHNWSDAVGLKPMYEGSIPSFLGFGRRLVLRRCGMGVGSHGFIQCLWWLILVVGFFVLM